MGLVTNGIDGGENLIPLLAEQQVMVAAVRAGGVPMEILGLNVEREHVGEQRGECAERSRTASAPRSVGLASRALPTHFCGSGSFVAALFLWASIWCGAGDGADAT